MSNYLYVKGSGYAADQIKARGLAFAQSLLIPDVLAVHETDATDDRLLQDTVRRLQPGEAVIIPHLFTLGDLPSVILKNASSIFAAGGYLLVVDFGGELDPVQLRRYVSMFLPLEDRVTKADRVLREERAKHRAELETYGNEVRQQMINALMRAGVDIAAIIAPKDGTPIKAPANPSRARELKDKRLSLGLTQEQAGQLVPEKPINKGQISVFENTGEGARIDEYETWLNIAIARKRAEAKRPKPEATADKLTDGERLKAADAEANT